MADADASVRPPTAADGGLVLSCEEPAAPEASKVVPERGGVGSHAEAQSGLPIGTRKGWKKRAQDRLRKADVPNPRLPVGWPAADQPTGAAAPAEHQSVSMPPPVLDPLPAEVHHDPVEAAVFDFMNVETETLLPIGCLLQGLDSVDWDVGLRSGLPYLLWTLCLVCITAMLRPVTSVFEMQNSILLNLAGATVRPQVMGSDLLFSDLDTFEGFWHWTETVMYPVVFGDPEGSFAVAKYNQVVMPVRFRQVRASEDDCGVPSDVHELARPCWPWGGSSEELPLGSASAIALGPDAFSQGLPSRGPMTNTTTSTQSTSTSTSSTTTSTPSGGPSGALAPSGGPNIRAPPTGPIRSGTMYFADGLSPWDGSYEGAHAYGTSGHVVDLELDAAWAHRRLQALVRERWADEGTRALVVELSTYNPNLDAATVSRFKLDRLLGGELVSSVEVCSFKLSPYSTGASDVFRLLLELAWLGGFFCNSWSLGFRLRRRGVLAELRCGWPAWDLVNIAILFSVVVRWIDFLSRDRAIFRERRPDDFEDLYRVCAVHDSALFWTVLVVACSILRACSYFCSSGESRFSVVWNSLAETARASFPLIATALPIAVLFAYAGNWLFGTQLRELHTFTRTADFLVRSFHRGFEVRSDEFSSSLYTAMKDVNPTGALLWASCWAFLSTLAFANMFVAIMVATFVSRRRRARFRSELRQPFPAAPSWWARAQTRRALRSKDLDLREPALETERCLASWRKHLAAVDHVQLRALLNRLSADGVYDLEVTEALGLFPNPDARESHRRAAEWLSALSADMGIRMAPTNRGLTRAKEVAVLTSKVAAMEEELMGLARQLRAAAPRAPYPLAI